MLKPYKENIETIKKDIYEIGQSVIRANETALNALKENNISKIVDSNLSISKLSEKSNEVDNNIVKTLALYSPEARDLREMVSYLKITNELIRAGANSKQFAKQFKKSFSEDVDQEEILEYAIPLLKASNEALILAISMINETDDEILDELYQKVTVEESKTDDLYAMVAKNILKKVKKDKDLLKEYFEVTSALRKLEKVADRATAISNLLVFAEIGGELKQV